VQDLIFDISKGEPTNYEYWTVNEDNEVQYLTIRYGYLSAIFEDVDNCSIESFISELWGFPVVSDTEYVSYDELTKFTTDIEIESMDKIISCGVSKYQILSVRGCCNCQCCNVDKNTSIKHLRSIPCMNSKPDWNVYTHKWPRFIEVLTGVIQWINTCTCTDSIVAWFGCEPDFYNPDIIDSIVCVFHIKDNSIKIVSDKNKAIALYSEYNKKYPTKDRQIEESFNNEKSNWYFSF